jgi:6-phosphogluconolactonase
MNVKTTWSRRAFLQSIGYTSASGMLNNWIPDKNVRMSSPEFAYIASGTDSAPDNFSDSGIHVYVVRGNDWICKQRISSRSPACLALHPNGHVLYVANEIGVYQGLPRGTVEAYRIDPHSGTLALMNRQPLSLSGIRPRDIAVSPDGHHMVVAIHGGGAYNMLPIHPDGSIGRVMQILKEVGAGAHPIHQTSAHPHSIIFDTAGHHLFTADEGCDRLSVFAVQNGMLTRRAQAFCMPGSAPGHLAIHSSGKFLYVSNTLDGSISSYRWDVYRAEIREIQRVSTSVMKGLRKESQLALSPSGGTLYAASADEGISVWETDPVTGKLSFRQRWSHKHRSLRLLTWSSGGKCIYAIDGSQEEILLIPVHVDTGELGEGFAVAKTVAPRALFIRSGPASLNLLT